MIESKIVTQTEAVRISLRLKCRGQKIVFTNGCFDLVHSGHAVYLRKAREKGDFLIVGLNRDYSVRRLKGPGRPILKFKERAILLAYLIPVDLVVGFGEDTPLRLIRKLKPDILVKGADYDISEIVGADEVLGWGGEVVRIPLVRGRSTTGLIDRLFSGRTR